MDVTNRERRGTNSPYAFPPVGLPLVVRGDPQTGHSFLFPGVGIVRMLEPLTWPWGSRVPHQVTSCQGLKSQKGNATNECLPTQTACSTLASHTIWAGIWVHPGPWLECWPCLLPPRQKLGRRAGQRQPSPHQPSVPSHAQIINSPPRSLSAPWSLTNNLYWDTSGQNIPISLKLSWSHRLKQNVSMCALISFPNEWKFWTEL